MAASPKPAVDLAHDISSLEQMLVTEKLNEKQERDLRKLISGLRLTLDSHSGRGNVLANERFLNSCVVRFAMA